MGNLVHLHNVPTTVEPFKSLGVNSATLDDGTPGLVLTITQGKGDRHAYWLDPDTADAVAGLLAKYARAARIEAELLAEDDDPTLGDYLERLDADDEDEGGDGPQ